MDTVATVRSIEARAEIVNNMLGSLRYRDYDQHVFEAYFGMMRSALMDMHYDARQLTDALATVTEDAASEPTVF